MSPLMRSECRKFAPNIFNKTKCTNCFRQKEEHSAEALESNRATRKVCKCGYLFVAPDWDFSNPINRTKRWQRRWFVLYDDGELTYSVDEHPDTVPQAVISLLSSTAQGGRSIVWEAPESETGHPHSLAVAAPERVHFVRGDTRDETRAWLASLLAVASPIPPQGTSRVRQARHKRNATFPGGRSNPLSMGVAQRVISGTTSVSGQHSPVLRQRFNSCISPLHHALPLEVNEVDRVVTHHAHSTPVCKTSSSTSISTSIPSEVLSSDSINEGNPLSTCSSMLRFGVTEDSLVSRSYFIGVDSSSSFCKDVESADVFMSPSKCRSTSTERISSGKSSEAVHDNTPSVSRSVQSEIVNVSIETPKCSPTNSWRKNSSTSEERHASLGLHSLVEKNVRGDPDGCVLDSISTSSCCSVEGSDHIDGLTTDQPTLSSQAKSENVCDERTMESIEGSSGHRDLSRQLPIRQESTKHGWLMKLGSSKEWSKHWFVLRGSGLLYYRDPSAEGIGILDGVIDLGLVSDVKEVTVERNHGLQLTTWDGKHCILSAVTPGIRSGWIAALRKAAGLSCLPNDQSLLQFDHSTGSLDTLEDNSGLGDLQSASDSSTLENDHSSKTSSDSLSCLSSPIHPSSSLSLKLDMTETPQSPLGGPVEHSNQTTVSLSQLMRKRQMNEPTSHVLDNRQDKTHTTSSLCNKIVGQTESVAVSTVPFIVDCLPKENAPSNRVLSGPPELPLESRGIQDKKCSVMSIGLISSLEANQNLNDPSYVGVSYHSSDNRTPTHKPPMSPAFVLSSCTRAALRRNSSSNCVRYGGTQTSDRSAAGVTLLESSLTDHAKPERPNFLSLKSLSSADSRESKSSGYAPSSYISSSASSCSLSDEDFRTASEASVHSTPISEIMVDSNSNAIVWSKSEISSDRGEVSSSYLPPDTGNDIGSVLPPSPPLNRTPISRVKERARSRVIRRAKTPPEDDIQSMKIESLSKRVKDLVSTLAAKEAELLKLKSAEAARSATVNKRSGNEHLDSKSKTGEGDGGHVAKKIIEEETLPVTPTSQVSLETSRVNEFDDGSSPTVTSSRRLSSSSVTPHSLPRMGSLSDLTNVDLDLDLNTVDHERLIEEWCSLRARFEKAVREIHALRKELRACQGRVDALELESSATSMCLAEERKRAEADMSLMANRVQDLTVKLSAAEKQVRQLKQKPSRVESREKRRSLSLRGDRDVRSGTDPSLGTGKLPKEISDRLTRLEATLASAVAGTSEKSLKSIPQVESVVSDISVGSEINGKMPSNGSARVVLHPVIESTQKKGDGDVLTSPASSKNMKESLEASAKLRDVPASPNVHAISGGIGLKSDLKTSNKDIKTSSESYEGNVKKGMAESEKTSLAKVETSNKVTANSSSSEQRRMRVQGRRQRQNSRLIRRTGDEEATQTVETGSVPEEEAEEVNVDDESSKGCDPLRILVRLGTLEGHVTDFLKTNKKGKKLPPANPTVVELPVSENKKSQETGKSSGNLCSSCEEMRLEIERLKKELLLVRHGISEENSVQKAGDGSSIVEKYREEIEQLRALCEKGMRAMDLSHHRLIKEMEEKHREEVVRVQIEKEQALREETKATLAALDAMRKAHETEVQREVAKFKEEFSRRMSAKQELNANHQAEMEGIRREILSLSQRYSSKCLECASLREQLRLSKGIKDKEHVTEAETLLEVLSGRS